MKRSQTMTCTPKRRYPETAHAVPTARALAAAALLLALATIAATSGSAEARGSIPVVVQVTHNTVGDIFDPRIRSEDGDRIVFVSDGDVQGPGTAPGHTEVYLYQVLTGQMIRVTNTPQSVVGPDGLGSWDASRSTDQLQSGGRPEYVTFVSRGDFDPTADNSDHNSEIFMWELVTGQFHQLTDTPSTVSNKEPFASDNGKCIVFSSSGNLDNNDGSDPSFPATHYTNSDGSHEVFLYGLDTAQEFPRNGSFTQVSNGPAGTTSSRPVIGGYIWPRQCQTTAYVSDWDQTGGTLTGSNIFIFDRNTATTTQMFAPEEIPWGIQPGEYLYPHISSASPFARGPFVVFQTSADLWKNNSTGWEIFRYRVFHPRMTQYTDVATGNVERPVVSDGGGYVTFQSTGEMLDPGHHARHGGEPPFNDDHNYEIFRMKGRRKIWQLTRTQGCTNTLPSVRNDATSIAFRSTCDLVPGGNSAGVPQVFVYREVKSDDPLATDAGCKVQNGCCNEANGCYQPILGRKPKTRTKNCVEYPRRGCKPPPA
jgi:WD40-like Beta Propeller Repeat